MRQTHDEAIAQSRWRTAWLLAALLAWPALAVGQAPPEADRAELEAKRKEQEERRREVERLKAEATKESSDQREARLRSEKRVADQQLALAKAQEAIKASARRQNRAGQLMMAEAWMLDPFNMDYPFNTAAFAEANGDADAEFWAYAGFLALAVRELEALGPSASDIRTAIEERAAKARARMDMLRKKVPSGVVTITVAPKDCEIYLDGAFVGKGKGTIEALTGQRRVRTDCLGYKPIDQMMNVRAGDANEATLEARSIDYYGYLIVVTKPEDGVTVFLDDVESDKRKGPEANADGVITGAGTKKDPFRLHARKWIVRFHKPGYDRWHRRVEIRRDQIVIVNAALEKMADTVEASGQ